MQPPFFARGVGRASPSSKSRVAIRALRLLVTLALLATALTAAGCAQQENVILLEVVSPEDVDELTITVIPLDGSAAPDSAPRPVNMTAAQIRENPVRIAIRLSAPRDVMVVLSADGPSADVTLVAQRCFAVAGVVRDSVWLVALGGSEDTDRDRFPRRAAASCARPSEDLTSPIACAGDDPFLCAAMGEIDCDDDDPTRYPGAPEMCADGVDQDCDGGDAACEDADGDGFSGCRMGDDPATCDCNDADASTFPEAADPCDDGLDQDCDRADDHCDVDCDGYPDARAGEDDPWVDCDDTEAATHPNETLRGIFGLADGDRRERGCEAMPMTTAASDMCTPGGGGEPVGDGVDQDCNGFIDDGPGCTDTNDRDRDGSRACTGGATTGCDTNDCDPGIAPTRAEVCGNAFDEDGDGTAQPCLAGDLDMDGHVGGVDDCDDGDPQVFGGAPENCLTTESESCTENIPCTSFGGDADGDGYLTGLPAGARGDCEDRVSFMVGTVMFRGADIYPFADEDPCDSVDNDCDGIVDEVLRAESAAPGAADGCVRTGGGATDVDYHLSAPYSEYCGGCGIITAANENCCSGVLTGIDQPASCGDCGYDCGPHTSCPRSGSDTGGDVHECACAPDASGNWADCDGSLTAGSGGNGCESDLDTDEMNCGGCGRDFRCGPHTTCVGGTCVCDAPYIDCDGSLLFPSGCEINGGNDVDNCRTCGNRCIFASGSPACVGGTCQLAGCDPGFQDCNATPGDGCETRLDTLTNCGVCTETCDEITHAVEICAGALGSNRCDYTTCDAGYLDCGGGRGNGCETPFTTANCGACGTVCGARESCTGGGDCQCGTGPTAATGEACSGGTPDCCGNACTDLQTDVNNCGACGNRCGTGESCSGGRCGCGATRAMAGMGEACTGGTPDCCGTTCVNVANSATNCGACGAVCGPSETCASGRCACGGTTASAVGAEACAGTGNECCGSSCQDTRTTIGHCGMCGRSCATTTVNATELCMASVCDYSSCDAGFIDCNGSRSDGCETNSRTLGNCGTCGNVCGSVANAVETCTGGGTCDYTACDPLFLDCDGSRPNGCEQTATVLGNCGACGNTCSSIQNATEICTAAGACDYSSCDPNFGDCSGGRSNGCETNLQTTLTACGMCTTNCNTTLLNTQAAGRTCTGGTCDYSACSSSSFADCDTMRPNGCETNLTSTLTRCGSCSTDCNTQLVNTLAAGRVCASSACNYATCAANFGDCDSMRPNGCETDLRTTLTSCGMCTTNCNTTLLNTQVAGRSCTGSACDYTACSGANFDDCDSNRANGCETNLTNTLNRCGSCTTNCNTTLLNTQMTGRVCTASACDYATCLSTHDDCDSNRENGCETMLGTTTNCGACGHACGAMETCVAGRCQCGTGAGAPTSAVGSGEACPMGPNPTCNAAMSLCE